MVFSVGWCDRRVWVRYIRRRMGPVWSRMGCQRLLYVRRADRSPVCNHHAWVSQCRVSTRAKKAKLTSCIVMKTEPNQPPQHNAGSRPSSSDSSASETPSSLGPRG